MTTAWSRRRLLIIAAILIPLGGAITVWRYEVWRHTPTKTITGRVCGDNCGLGRRVFAIPLPFAYSVEWWWERNGLCVEDDDGETWWVTTERDDRHKYQTGERVTITSMKNCGTLHCRLEHGMPW